MGKANEVLSAIGTVNVDDNGVARMNGKPMGVVAGTLSADAPLKPADVVATASPDATVTVRKVNTFTFPPVTLKKPNGYQTNHLDIQLAGTEPERLAWLFHGSLGVKMKNGQVVDSPAKAIRWLIQQIEIPQ